MKNLLLLFFCFTTVICLHAGFFIYTPVKEENKGLSQMQKVVKISFATLQKGQTSKVKKQLLPSNSTEKKIEKILKKAKKNVQNPVSTSKQMNQKTIQKSIENEIQKNTQKVVMSSNMKKKIKETYLSTIQKTIEENKYYPKRAKRLKQEDTVIIEFNIHKNGSIHSLYIKNKSSYRRLNKAALLTIKNIVQFAPIPNEFNKKTLKITVPISFVIRSS